jgi:hypothetical protein
MALTDTKIRQLRHSGKPAGDKYTDGDGMYLLVKAVDDRRELTQRDRSNLTHP